MLKKYFIKLVSQSKGWGTKRICKEFLTKKWAVSFVEDQHMIGKTNSIELKTGSGRPLTVSTEQNHKHVIEQV